MSQLIIVKPLGLITQPNKLSGIIPPGALSQADLAYMRRPGTIENAKAWITRGSVTLAGSPTQSFVFPMPATYNLALYRNTTNRLAWIDVTSGTSTFDLPFQNENAIAYNLPSDARFGLFTARDRVIVTAERGTLAVDATTPGSSGAATPRAAGMYPITLSGYVATNAGVGTAFQSGKYALYTIVARRTSAGGYVLVSPPSLPQQFFLGTSPGTFPCDVQLSVELKEPFTKAGDVLELYRTRAQAASVTGTSLSSMTATGADYYLCGTHVLTAADITAGNYSITDTCPDELLGEALYTNSAVQGAGAATLPPPNAKCTAYFRNHAFYANIVDPPQFKFRIPVHWGSIGTVASGMPAGVRRSGIGSRVIAGALASGAFVITGVVANDLIGVVVGQRFDVVSGGSPWASVPTITAIGATTITLDTVSTTASAGPFLASDVIFIDGNQYSMASFQSFTSLSRDRYDWIVSALSQQPPKYASPTDPGIPNTVPSDYVVVRKTYITSVATGQTFTVKATNGANYVPSFPDLTATAQVFTETVLPSRIQWSEEAQPENCPALNIDDAGRAEVYASIATRDALWFFCSDGLFRLSGTGGSAGEGYDWRIDPVDTTISLSGPWALCALRDTIYAYTNRGLVSVDSSGNVNDISQFRLNDVLPGPPWQTQNYTQANAIFLAADETNDEIWMREPLASGGRVWVYNTITDSFTQDIATTTPFHGAYSRALQSVVVTSTDGTLKIPNPSETYSTAQLRFQPVYSDDQFSLKHWQIVDVAFELGGSASCTVGLNQFGSIGTRALTSFAESEYARAGYSVPVAAPAVSNNISPTLTLTSAASMRMQGLSIRFNNLTDQRKNR